MDAPIAKRSNAPVLRTRKVHMATALAVYLGLTSGFLHAAAIRIIRNGIAVSSFENGNDHYLTTHSPTFLPGAIVLGDDWNCSTPRYRFLMPPPRSSPNVRQLESVKIYVFGQGSGTIGVGQPELYIGGHYDGSGFVWGSSEGALPEAHTQVVYQFDGDDARNLITLNPDTNLHELNVVLDVRCGISSNEYYVLERITVDLVFSGVPDAWVESYLLSAGAEQTLREFNRQIVQAWPSGNLEDVVQDGFQKAIAFAQSLYDLDTDLIDALLELPSVFDALVDFINTLDAAIAWYFFELCTSFEGISYVQGSIGPMADVASAWRSALQNGCLPTSLSTEITQSRQQLSSTIVNLRSTAQNLNRCRGDCENCALLKLQALGPVVLFNLDNGQERLGQEGETISYLPAIVEELTRQQEIATTWALIDVSASDGAFCDKVRVSWNEFTGATGYKVYRSTSNSGCAGSPIATPTANSFDDSTATPGQTYYYSVRATATCGDSDCSDVDSGFATGCGKVAACCFRDQTGSERCQNLTEAQCDAQLPSDAPRMWQSGQLCGQGRQWCPRVACMERDGSCVLSHGSSGCDDPYCCTQVCLEDPSCCEVSWNETCAFHGSSLCEGSVEIGACCYQMVTVLRCENLTEAQCQARASVHVWQQGASCDAHEQKCPSFAACCFGDQTGGEGCQNLTEVQCNAQLPSDSPRMWQAGQLCGLGPQWCPRVACMERDGSCLLPHGSPGCDQPFCCTDVCLEKPWCCEIAWDATCANEAEASCEQLPCLGDFNGDGERDLLDFGTLQLHFAEADQGLGGGDVNEDGMIDLSDVALFVARMSAGCP